MTFQTTGNLSSLRPYTLMKEGDLETLNVNAFLLEKLRNHWDPDVLFMILYDLITLNKSLSEENFSKLTPYFESCDPKSLTRARNAISHPEKSQEEHDLGMATLTSIVSEVISIKTITEKAESEAKADAHEGLRKRTKGQGRGR